MPEHQLHEPLPPGPGNPAIPPKASHVHAAHALIKPLVRRTPIMTSRQIDQAVGAQVFFKCEHLQSAGAFKFRGATHAMALLYKEERARGVITHSSGNHAGAVALAAKALGIQATIVMPTGSNPLKKTATLGYGARVIECENSQESREKTCREEIERTGMNLLHPYDDHRILCGAGTAALELFEDVPDLDAVITPVGGGGLLAGTATALAGLVKVYGAEPKGACDAYDGFQSGTRVVEQTPNTIADGLRTCLGERNFPIICRRVQAIGLALENEILEATWLVQSRMKQLIEPSSALPLACLLNGSLPVHPKIGIIISGGNVDLKNLATQYLY